MHHLPVPMDGIDISRHQKEIKWGQLMNGEHRPKFVYARCMGLDLRHDVRYDSYVDSAQQYDVPLGTYLFYTNYNKHFLELEEDTLSTDSMQGKVRAVSGSALIHYLEFKERVDKKKQKLLPVIDVEEQSVFDFAEDRHMERPYDKYLKFNVFILACLLRAEYGERPIIYSNQNFYSRFLAPTFDDYPLWIARYRTLHVPSPKSDLPFPYAVKPIMWQFTDRGLLRGIPHYVDMDHFVNDATLETIKIKDKV
jgi:lysozyme